MHWDPWVGLCDGVSPYPDYPELDLYPAPIRARPLPSLLPPSAAPVVTGTGPNFSLGELQGHLAYDLNPASTGMRRTLPSSSSSGYVPNSGVLARAPLFPPQKPHPELG